MNRILSLLLIAVCMLSILSGCTLEEPPYVPTGDALDNENNNTIHNRPQQEQALTLA